MSVIGFDIGNDTCVIAAAKHGGIDVLLNHESKRETPAVISFGDKQRFLGSAGAAFATSNPKQTVSQIKRLIGKRYKEVEEELKLLPFATTEGPRGGVVIELEFLKQKFRFTPVEILGMLFKHLKQIGEQNLECAVVDCVIGIPSYFSDLQRRLYLDAAGIAGLKPLRLMHDGTSIALGYGMYKTDFESSGQSNVMFVDIGHCDTQVTVAGFEPGRMKILSHSFDQDLGGRDFDEVLFKHFAVQFEEKYRIDVCGNVRACVRLRAACEKVKKVLSANADAPISIECLVGDTDVKGFVTRDEFENLSSGLLERVVDCCKKALKDSGLCVNEMHTVELVGSGSRVPAVTRVLTSFFGKEPTRTLNASECVARGCALRCAMLSPTLQVRDYKIMDSFPYSIVIPPPEGPVKFFRKGSSFPNKKMMTRTGSSSFDLQVAYRNKRDFPAGISHIIGRFVIGPPENSDTEEVKVKISVTLNHNGIVEIDSATMIKDRRTYFPRFRLSGDSQMVSLPVTENVDVSTTDDELVEAIEKEKMLAEQDIKVEEIKDQRNTLESFVYDTRSKLSGAYQKFATDSEKEVLIKSLQETEDWLYEDSDDESEQDYTGKLDELKKLLEPIEDKYNEENALAKATKALQSCIAEYRSRADSLPADKKEKVKDVCTDVERWFAGLSQKHLPPKTMSSHINKAIDIFQSKCKSIISYKPSFSRREEPVDCEKEREEAAKPLLTCIENCYLLAESLPDDKKQKVQVVCREAEQWLIDAISNKQLSPKTLSNDSNRNVKILERECQSIISSKSSIPKHEETVDSDSRDETVKPDQDQPVDSKNAVTEAMESLQTCITKYCLHAESLPADMKEEVNNVCKEAERRFNAAYQVQSSPDALTTYINELIVGVESTCGSMIKSKSSSPRHAKSVNSDSRNQIVKSDQKDQPVDSENAVTEATKALQACIAKYRSHAESLPADLKEKVNDPIQKQLSPNALTISINHIIEVVESTCEGIIKSKASSPRHGKSVDSNQRDQTVKSDQKDQLVDSENAVTEAKQALLTHIAKYRSHAEAFSADIKAEVNNECVEAERLLNVILQKNFSLNTLKNYINNLTENVERNCESLIRSKPSSSSHEKHVDSDQRGQPMDTDQVLDQGDQPMDMDQVDQSVDSDPRMTVKDRKESF